MRHSRLLLLVTCAALLAAGPSRAAEPEGVAIGWGSADGAILLQELNCTSCHAGQTAAAPRQAPRLSEAGSRITPQYLRRFLADPQQAKPGTPMPHLLHGQSEAQRRETVEALVHFLVSQGGPIDQHSSGSSRVQLDRGRDLYHSVGCVACHQAFEPPPSHQVDAATAAQQELLAEEEAASDRPQMSEIPLGELASKTTVEQLAKFLDDPLHVRPSGRMPRVQLQPGESRFIASYLLREQYTEGKSAPGPGLDVAYYEGNWDKVPNFEELTPKWEGEAKQIDLDAVAPGGRRSGRRGRRDSNFAVRFEGQIVLPADGEYRFWTRSDDGTLLWIDETLVVDNDGMHAATEKEGRIQLKAGSHLFRLGFVQGGGPYEMNITWQPPGGERGAIPADVLRHNAPAAMIPTGLADFQLDSTLAARGGELFATLGCAACHELKPAAGGEAIASRLEAPALEAVAAANRNGGCLSENVAAPLPRFALSPAQRAALREQLGDRGEQPDASRDELAHALATFSCYACHRRGELGGPSAQKTDYFGYEILVDWGEEGRLPPAINEVGAKLTEAGFNDMLFDAKRYRTYMATRMPQYGKQNIGHLPDLFRAADGGKVPSREPRFTPRMVDDGRQLVGKQKLACINCHAWGELRLQGAEGLDLLEATRRLQPGWFHALLENPQVLRPRTRMPTGWPDGKSFFPEIEEGDMHRQIDAIWAYLSVGRKGGPPPGLTPDDETLLTPTDEPIVFRTFLDGYSSHAILVGFRQRTHMAFDANRVKTVAAWTGDFISARPSWDGRAGQYAPIPSVDVVKFPEGPALARLPSITQPWPKDVSQQRLAASRRPEGWQFRGYRLDAERVPTLLYSAGEVDIEETPGTGYRRDGAVLTRSFKLTSPSAIDDLYLIVARGETIDQEAGAYTIDGRLHYRLQSNPPSEAYIRESEGRQELLLPIRFAAAGNPHHQAEVELELTW